MSNEGLIKYVSNELNYGNDVEFEFRIDNILYKIKFLSADIDSNINIPSILAIPLSPDINNQLMVETNNLESEDLEKIIEQGGQTGIRLAKITNNFPCPIVVPLIPSYNGSPYFQQLSQECFDISSEEKNYRIDEQVVRIIEKVKFILKSENDIIVKDKIFLNGYSSSGVFAQRFALLHPEIVEIACIGGASGSIPIPTEKLSYPIGIANFEKLTSKKFDLESYSKIKFRYYVGELETQDMSDSRVDDLGNPAPIHDMSYFERSVPVDVGKQQRKILGMETFSRAKKTVEILQDLGMDIQHKIILGRNHSNRNGIGVNELGDKFIKDTYRKNIVSKQKNEELTI